jgi:hypothetical protein
MEKCRVGELRNSHAVGIPSQYCPVRLRVSLLLRVPRGLHGRQPVRHDLPSRPNLKIQAAAR